MKLTDVVLQEGLVVYGEFVREIVGEPGQPAWVVLAPDSDLSKVVRVPATSEVKKALDIVRGGDGPSQRHGLLFHFIQRHILPSNRLLWEVQWRLVDVPLPPVDDVLTQIAATYREVRRRMTNTSDPNESP